MNSSFVLLFLSALCCLASADPRVDLNTDGLTFNTTAAQSNLITFFPIAAAIALVAVAVVAVTLFPTSTERMFDRIDDFFSDNIFPQQQQQNAQDYYQYSTNFQQRPYQQVSFMQ